MRDFGGEGRVEVMAEGEPLPFGDQAQVLRIDREVELGRCGRRLRRRQLHEPLAIQRQPIEPKPLRQLDLSFASADG